MQARAAERFCHNRSHIVMRITRQKRIYQGKTSMGAARPRRTNLRTSKSRRRLQKSNKRSGALWLETVDHDEFAQTEEIDRLLLSSLRLWEVERDLIEERIAAIKR
jgi:hypothetical protein